MNEKRNKMTIFSFVFVFLHFFNVTDAYHAPNFCCIFFASQKNDCKLYLHEEDYMAIYSSVYKYVTANDTAIEQIMETFKTVQKIKKRTKINYCIDSIAQPLIISGFGAIKDTALRARIRCIDSGKVPGELMKFSTCTGKRVLFNLTFSVLNKSYITAEISTRFLNLSGGSSKGPSIKYLFYFDDSNVIQKVLYQKYLNG